MDILKAHKKLQKEKKYLNIFFFIFAFRLLGSRSSCARCLQIKTPLFYEQRLVPRYLIYAAYGSFLLVVATKHLWSTFSTLPGHCTLEPFTSSTAHVGVVRSYRNRNRLSKCLPYMQSGVGHIGVDTLECLHVFCNKLCPRFRYR